MTRRRIGALLLFSTLSACSVSDSTAPPGPGARAPASQTGVSRDLTGTAILSGSSLGTLQCTVPTTLHGSAVIGRSGGTVVIGPHRFVVPPGSVDHQTLITATIPAGSSIVVDFQPTGLTFNKPAALVIDATVCAQVPTQVPVYLKEIGSNFDQIRATILELLHVIIAPIDHFSSYALDV
jgi:hypothetical protein